MLKLLTGIFLGTGLIAGAASAQTTTSTVLTGEASGFVAADSTMPDPFVFNAVTGVTPDGIPVVSNIVTISGITEPVQASVSDRGTGGVPQISINGQAYAATGTVEDGDSVRVSIVPAVGVYSQNYQAEVTVGDGSAIFQVTTRPVDTVPDTFFFSAVTNQEAGTLVVSGPATITGLEASSAVSVSGAGTPQVSLDGGNTWVSSGTVANNGTIRVRLVSGVLGETRSATVSVGGVTATFDVTSRSSSDAAVLTDFTDQTGVNPNVVVVSDPITVSGIETAVNASVSGDGLPEISVDGGSWVSAGTSTSVSNGAQVRIRLTSGDFGQTRSATLNVNGVTGAFNVTTRLADTTPDSFTLTSVTNASPSSTVISSPATITGIEAAAAATVSGDGAPEFSLDGGTTWATSGTVSSGSSIIVRLISGALDETRVATLTVGGVITTFSVTVRPQDTAPDSFTFADKLAAPGTTVTSDPATLSGFEGSVSISVSGSGSPNYRIDGGEWMTEPGTVTSGRQVQIRLTASNTESASRSATLTVGSTSASLTVTTQDISPEEFSLTPVTGAEPSALITSDTAIVSGVTGSVAISVTGVIGAEYQIEDRAWTSAAGSVESNETIRVRMTASGEYGGQKILTLNIGSFSTEFSVTTRNQNTAPDDFSFSAALVAPGGEAISNLVTLAGFEGSVAIEISGDGSPVYSIDGGAYVSTPGTVTVGQTVQIRLTASLTEGGTRLASLEVGGVTRDFSVTTQDLSPNAFAFSAVTGATAGAQIASEPTQISGITGAVTVSVSEGNGGQFRVGSGPVDTIVWGDWSDHTTAGSISNGGWVQARLTSDAAFETARSTTVTVGSASATFTVTTASEPVSFELASASVPDGEEGIAYVGFDLKGLVTFSGGPSGSAPSSDDLTWAVTSGAVPTGLNLSAGSGVIAGTPDAIGAYSFTVTATYPGGVAASRAYTIIVNDPDGSFVLEGG